MKECDMETLDKMFPDGYVIVYTNPDGQIRCNKFNPHMDNVLEYCNDICCDAK